MARRGEVVETISLATRSGLIGDRIGFLWEKIFRGNEIFPILEIKISERFDKVELVGYENFGSTVGHYSFITLTNISNYLKKIQINAILPGIGC